ncbi:DMT family transporter [Paenibacillus sp. GCM10027627]|uniref:DMT family transporter n=1 Tax=unclassified Paenibacillus TaxID=185978 RepID=UPI003624C813
MNPYFMLAFAIVSEVFGSTMLKLSKGFTKKLPAIGVLIGMGTAFYLMSQTLQTLPLGTVYAIWSGAGTALTATIGIVVWKEHLDWKKALGLVCIIAGVVVMKLASDGSH